MTGNEPGVTGGNDDGTDADTSRDGATDGEIDGAVDGTGESRRRSMIEAEDTAEQKTRADRADRAEAGDREAQAEQSDAERGASETASRVDTRPDRVRHAAEWLDGKLVPRLGGPDLGPYDEESEESVRTHDACPLCGHPMGEHQIDRSHPNAVLICPAEQIPPRESHEPLNEVGMPKRSAQGES
jgi:hypothetical protein